MFVCVNSNKVKSKNCVYELQVMTNYMGYDKGILDRGDGNFVSNLNKIIFVLSMFK